MSLTEDSALRRERYPHKGLGLPVVLDDYEKLDFEERWRTRRAVRAAAAAWTLSLYVQGDTVACRAKRECQEIADASRAEPAR